MNVDYRLLPRFEASWALADAARAARTGAAPRDRLFAAETRWDGDRISTAAAVALRRWLEDDR